MDDKKELLSSGLHAAIVVFGGIVLALLIIGFEYLERRIPSAKIAKQLSRPRIKTNRYEDAIAHDIINPNDINVTFDSIGGLEKIKQELHELVVLPILKPNLFAKGKLFTTQKGILLHGPPGTGKTLLAKAIAKESGAVFINAKLSSLLHKFCGENEKHVTALFTLAHKLQPAVIFIDEVDSILTKRREQCDYATHLKTTFMTMWDGLTTDQNSRVVVLAATNRRYALDEAILRRLPIQFEVAMPDSSDRAKILRTILKDENVEDDIDCDHIASLCEGYSGSNLMDLCKQVVYFPLREFLKQEKNGQLTSQSPRPLKQSDIENALSVWSLPAPTNVIAEDMALSVWSSGPRVTMK